MVTEKAANQSDGNTTFLRAARSGNLEKVLEFINANVDINTSNSNGLNALHLASKDGHKEVVAELLKRGANVDAATKKGNTALHIASLAGQEEVVKLLIENGASVNVQSQSGFTPLYMAAQENHERVVRYLLNNGANQSLATEDGFTPLAVAMQQGHEKVVTELLENDIRGKIRLPALHIAAKKDDCKAAALLLQSDHSHPDITSKSGFTPLHIASHYGNDAIASLLLAKGADVNYAAKHNITPLHVAAKWGRNNMVLLLLDKGASIVAKTRDGLTPLHCAARSGHEQVVDTLLQRHAPITAKTKNGLAPLHMASQGDHVEAARVLLLHRAPVDDVTVDYLTALHVASHCGHVSVAKLLLDRKADPNARALNGFTPLHIACKKNRVKVVELLLKHGASIESTTESGLSPLHVASFMGCMNIVIYLLQCEANPDVSTIRGETPLHLASRANQTDIIRILLRNGAQVDAKAREQQTPLHIASRLGNQDIVMLLLQHGANVDSATKDQYTPLHIAAKEDQEEVAQVLLDNNASMTATTKKGFTPLHLASKYGRTKIATLLLQRGAPVDAQGKNGVTPLHVASHYDHQGIALLLLDKGASPHAIAKNGHTPLHIAAKKNQMDIAAMLLEYGASAEVESKAGFTPLHLSAQEGHADMTNLLLEHKSNVNHSSKNGLTPIHLCAQEDCVEVAKILVQNGAELNAVTKAGYTPLHIASHFGQLNMVRYLLSQKVNVECSTATGYTPLHQAAQQGNSAIVAILLDSGASPDSKNNQGQTALCIAQKLGYISVVEVLKNVTETSKAPAAATGNEEKYKVVAPETMQENFMSDSEDEGGDDVVNEQSYRYLTIDEMKSLGDDSLPLDVTREDRYDTTAGIDESISPQHTYNQLSAAPHALDNVDVSRGPIVQSGFLVSFLVDAKGGAMRGCRHSGVRVIVPPQCVTMPTRVTCRYVRRDKPNHPPPPPLMEGEALASRILELGPVGVKFLGPVVIEVPNFAALRGNEREIVILRSDNGETWREHTVNSSNEAVQEILSRSFDKDGNQIQADEPARITSIVTNDFPHYFAVVSRIRQEVHAIGPEGGMVSSSVVPQVQAVFPPGALTKKIKVGLQAQPIPSDLTAAVLGNCVAVSPIVTIEPRRRKFHKPITLTLPVPQAANKGMINQYSGDSPTLRLLCSITGGTSRAQWEDVTGSTPLTFVKECVSFTTTVSARFWLMDVRDIAVATKKASELYCEAIHIPFMAKFVVFAKRVDNNEARLRVFCMTDDKEDKTLECQEHFIEVAKSRDVEVLEGKVQLVELSGNLISVTKSGDQLRLGFHAFQENRLPFTVRLKDSHSDPIGRMLFFKEQKPAKMGTPHPPVCVLNIVLPDGIVPDHDLLDSPMRNYSYSNDVQGYHRSELRFSDISNLIGEDWLPLSEKLGINNAEAAVIRSEYPESVPKQALTMLRIWHQQAGNKASANILESALLSIGRDDIVQECILNTPDMSKKKLIENGLQPSKNVMSHIIEDYRIGKHDISSTDDDEKKYTAEEKVILDDEPTRSVSERKTEIEKRLRTAEPTKRLSKELPGDAIEARASLDKEPAARRPSSQSKDATSDEKDAFEPTTLTFEQKRLSFERGLSFDKGAADLAKESGSVDKLVQMEKQQPQHEVKGAVVEDEKILQLDEANLKIEQPELKDSKEEHFRIVKEPKGAAERFLEQEREQSFAEKRLSFEAAADAKVADKPADDAAHLAKSEGERRDSALFEGVSLGLEKLEAKVAVTEQNFLSPKPLKTPPPSPAEFKGDSWKKQDSEESNKSDTRPDKRTIDVSECSSKSDFSSDETVVESGERANDVEPRRRPHRDRRPSGGRRRASEALWAGRPPVGSNLRCMAQLSCSSSSASLGSQPATGGAAGGHKLNMVSFKEQFAASCLPSCVWNRSLPNLALAPVSRWPTPWSRHAGAADGSPPDGLSHGTSVEYFTPPQRDYRPQCGAYCEWLPSDGGLAQDISDHTMRLQPAVSRVAEPAASGIADLGIATAAATCSDAFLSDTSIPEAAVESISIVQTQPVQGSNHTGAKIPADPMGQSIDPCKASAWDGASRTIFDVHSANVIEPAGIIETVSASEPSRIPKSFELDDSNESSSLDSVSSIKHGILPISEPSSVDSANSIDSANSVVTIIETTTIYKNGTHSAPNTIVTQSFQSFPVASDADPVADVKRDLAEVSEDLLNAIVDPVATTATSNSIAEPESFQSFPVTSDADPVADVKRDLAEVSEDLVNAIIDPVATTATSNSIAEPVVASPRCEFIKSESISEITFEDVNALCKEKEDLEPLIVDYEASEEVTPLDPDLLQDEARRNELIDLLIEKENAKLIASGILGYDDSDSDESDENNESEPRGHLQPQAAVYESDEDSLEFTNGLDGSSKREPMPKQNTYDIIEEHCILRDSSRSYHKLGDPGSSSEHHHVESSERSPQRKVAFRLNSADDELVYPGQTDSEECNSSSDNSEECNSVEERIEEEDSPVVAFGEDSLVTFGDAPVASSGDPPSVTFGGAPLITGAGSPVVASVVTKSTVTTTEADGDRIVTTIVSTCNFKPTSEVERKFERMASQSLEECGPVAEGEFQKIVSQLSVEEVDDCLNEWNVTQRAASGDDRSPKIEGDKRQHSNAARDTPPVSPRDGVPKVDTDKRECTDYLSKKKFWQSFESTSTTTMVGSDSKLPAPVPKPRASICTTGLTNLPDTSPLAPAVSRRSSENIGRVLAPPIREDKSVNKSESEDNVLIVAATADTAATKARPPIRQMHSLTISSLDSEAEYIASCDADKLAYENMAFSEEEESRAEESAVDLGNVKAKKMFFEQQIHSSQEDNLVQSPEDGLAVDIRIEKSPRVSKHSEEHLDKSELESSEKKKQSSMDDVEDPSTATPIDMLLTNGCSVGGSADSTRSESDFTPEELRSVSDLSVEAVSDSIDARRSVSHSDSEHSTGHMELEMKTSKSTEVEQLEKIDLLTTQSAKSLSSVESSCTGVEKPDNKSKKVIEVTSDMQNVEPSDVEGSSKTTKSAISDISQKIESINQKPSINKLDSREKVKSSIPVEPCKTEVTSKELPEDKSKSGEKESIVTSTEFGLNDSVFTVGIEKTKSDNVKETVLSTKKIGIRTVAEDEKILDSAKLTEKFDQLEEIFDVTIVSSPAEKSVSPKASETKLASKEKPDIPTSDAGKFASVIPLEKSELQTSLESEFAKDRLKDSIEEKADHDTSSFDVGIPSVIPSEKLVPQKPQETKSESIEVDTAILADKSVLQKTLETELECSEDQLKAHVKEKPDQPKDAIITDVAKVSTLQTSEETSVSQKLHETKTGPTQDQVNEIIEEKPGQLEELSTSDVKVTSFAVEKVVPPETVEIKLGSTELKDPLGEKSYQPKVISASDKTKVPASVIAGEKTVPQTKVNIEKVEVPAVISAVETEISEQSYKSTDVASKPKLVDKVPRTINEGSLVEQTTIITPAEEFTETKSDVNEKISSDLKTEETSTCIKIISEKKSEVFEKSGTTSPQKVETTQSTDKSSPTVPTDKTLTSDTTSTIKKSDRQERTILEKVITSKIPVSSVITTKRISISDSHGTDLPSISSVQNIINIEKKDLAATTIPTGSIQSSTSEEVEIKNLSGKPPSDLLQDSKSIIDVTKEKPTEIPASDILEKSTLERRIKSEIPLSSVITTTEQIIEKEPSSESTKTVIITKAVGGSEDESIHIEKTNTIDPKISELPLTETTKTTIITSEKSGGFTQTRTIQEKVILSPTFVTGAPVTSIITTKDTVDEFPTKESKETTVITSYTSGVTEKSFLTKDKLALSISASSIISTDESVHIDPLRKTEEIEKHVEVIPSSMRSTDEVISKQVKDSIDSIEVATNAQISESVASLKQLEESDSKISKISNDSPPKEEILSKHSNEKITDETIPRCEKITKEDSTSSVSKIPKPGSFSKAGSVSTSLSSDEVITSTSITETKTLLKDSKSSSIKESRIPVCKMVSREKSDESITSPKASIKLPTSSTETSGSNAVISSCHTRSDSKTSKEVESIIRKFSSEAENTDPLIRSSAGIDIIPEVGKPEESFIIQRLESSIPIQSKSKTDSSSSHEQAESTIHCQLKSLDQELRDTPSGMKVCDSHLLSSSSIHEDDSSHEGDDISDEQIVTYGYSDKRISISEDEAKVAAENLIDEIETELNQRPDLVENLLLSQMDLLCHDTSDLSADDSNDITDEDLRSIGTEVDTAVPECSDSTKKRDSVEETSRQAKIKISEASPTEYEINYEQVEEFSVQEPADFEEHIMPDKSDLDKDNSRDPSFGLENCLERTTAKPPIPEGIKKPPTAPTVPEIRRKSSEESTPRTDILSPESGSSDTVSKRYEDANSSPSLVLVTRTRRHHEIDPCSSSSESHYHSFTSRPCSSDIENLLSLSAVPGSSEYETAASRDTSSYSHEFHTAVSSASIHDSLKSMDSESSGHLGSAEVSSEMSETLVPSSGELEHDIDFPGGVNALFEDTPRNIYSKTFLEPYDQDIPINVIKGSMQISKLEQPVYKSDAIYDPLLDDRLQSSCEDTSSLSITDGGANVQTIVEVPSTESDKMDNSLISEQNSLTISAISNQLSTSSSDFKDEVETDRKTVDTNTMSTSHQVTATPGSTTSVTLLTSVSEDQGRHNVNTQVTSSVEPISAANTTKSPDVSPDLESFELVEKPDFLDDFVVIEEVAKEACELDTEGRSIRIMEKRKSSNFDDDVLLPPPQTTSTLTHVEYYEPNGGTNDDACFFERVTFEDKHTINESYETSLPDNEESYAREVEEGKKWIEMQFQTDSEATAYEYGYERAPLEDIKEEDTDDMQSSKVGSVSSQISQSIGSLGSMKQSLSSTPDYDILAGKRYFSKSAEPDTISQASLQEFERLEQLMALESMKGKLSASQDSLSSGGNEKKCSIAGDDISVSSLKEFEGLELACGEVEKIEARAKAEEHCLSQIEEGHESQASESESCETLEKSCYESDVDEDDYDKKMFEIDEIIRQAQSNVEKFADRLEKTESLGRGDSFEETSRIPELEFDLPQSEPLTATRQLSSNLYSGKKYIENVDLSQSLTESTDSLELKHGSITSKYLDDPVTSTDSLEGGSSGGKSKLEIASDSLDNRPESPKSEATELLVHDEYDSSSICRLSPYQISSPDSADATSSAATNATYQNEMDSIMSSSFTSVESNTMVSSTENLEHVVSNYSSWLEGGQQATSVTTTKLVESSSDGIETHVSSTRRTIEMPMEVEGVKVVCKGPQAKKMLEQEIASFKPGEYVTETREVDADGKVRVRRVIETRTVLTSEQVERGRTTWGGSGGDVNISGGSGSCSKVTTSIIRSDLTLAGPVPESNSKEDKKKDMAADISTDVKKNP